MPYVARVTGRRPHRGPHARLAGPRVGACVGAGLQRSIRHRTPRECDCTKGLVNRRESQWSKIVGRVFRNATLEGRVQIRERFVSCSEVTTTTVRRPWPSHCLREARAANTPRYFRVRSGGRWPRRGSRLWRMAPGRSRDGTRGLDAGGDRRRRAGGSSSRCQRLDTHPSIFRRRHDYGVAARTRRGVAGRHRRGRDGDADRLAAVAAPVVHR